LGERNIFKSFLKGFQPQNGNGVKPKNGMVPDKKTAIKIAEAI